MASTVHRTAESEPVDDSLQAASAIVKDVKLIRCLEENLQVKPRPGLLLLHNLQNEVPRHNLGDDKKMFLEHNSRASL